MKIIIHSIEELLQLTELIRPPQTTNVTNHIDVKSSGVAGLVTADILRLAGKRDGVLCAGASEPDGLPDDIDAPQAVEGGVAIAPHATGRTVDTPAGPVDANLAAALGIEDQEFPLCDSDGAPYSTDWHSAPQKLTDKGVWRAKRGRDAADYLLWLRDNAVNTKVADEEPVATETHALPQVEPETAGDTPDAQVEPETAGQAAPAQPASTVDLQALVAASQEAAMDAKDGLQDLLAGCRDFTSAHGTAEFNALKAAVAPRGDTGASLQEFTPAERRLMLACIADYPKKEA